jgi:cyclic pyranopterin phosphate synthase
MLRFVRALRPCFTLNKIRLTGGEPLLRPGIVEVVRALAGEGVPDLAMTTNGQILAPMAADLADAGLRRVNVSLDSLDQETYRRITRGGQLRRTLEGIDEALRRGLGPVKLNVVVLRGLNDGEIRNMALFALETGCDVRFLEYMPSRTVEPGQDRLFVPSEEVLSALKESFRLDPLPGRPGETCRGFLATDRRGRRGRIGIISPVTGSFCRGCTRIRLTSSGELIGCLARGGGHDVRGLLGEECASAGRSLRSAVAGALASKRARPVTRLPRSMVAVGG